MADMSAEASAKTLWMGDLAYWMDETFVYSVFVGALAFVDPHGAIVPGASVLLQRAQCCASSVHTGL